MRNVTGRHNEAEGDGRRLLSIVSKLCRRINDAVGDTAHVVPLEGSELGTFEAIVR